MKLFRISQFILVIILIFSCVNVANAAEPYFSYLYDYWGDPVPVPHSYLPAEIIDGTTLGVGEFNAPSDLFVATDNRILIVDSGNNRVLIFNDEWELIQNIDRFIVDNEADGFSNPQGVFVTTDGEIYIADTDNGRIVHMDSEGNFLRELGAPTSDILPQNFNYRPTRIIVDKGRRIYVIAQDINQGIIELDKDGGFKGFMGASRVTPSMIDYFWKWIATDEQRERMELFVPTEYNNISIDKNGFIYVTTSTINRYDLQTAVSTRSTDDRFAPIRKLNPTGTDVLRRRGFFPPVGDVNIPFRGPDQGPSQLVDVSVQEYGIYSVLDRKRGRIFTYDNDSNLLFIFGGNGNRLGNFRSAAALEFINDQYIVLDSALAQITVFDATEYGKLVRDAVSFYHKGLYEESSEAWADIIKLNVNSDLSYIGMGKAYMRQDNFAPAVKSFKLANKREYYTKAYQLYRKDVIERNFGWIAAGLLIVIVFIINYVKKKSKSEVDM